MITNQRIVHSVDSADTNSRTVYKCSCIFDYNYRILYIISQLGDSNEHHKLKFYRELTNYVFLVIMNIHIFSGLLISWVFTMFIRNIHMQNTISEKKILSKSHKP